MYEFPQKLRCDLRLSIFKNREISRKSLKYLELKAKPIRLLKMKILTVALKSCKKNSNKTFHWKTYLFNFENLSTILYPRLYLPTLLCLSNYQTTCWHLSWLTNKFTTTKSTISTFFKNCMIATIISDNFSGKKLSYIRRITGKGTRLLMTR